MVGGCARNEGRLKMDPPAVLALEARELQLERARLPQPVAALDRARAEGRAAVALVHTALAKFLAGGRFERRTHLGGTKARSARDRTIRTFQIRVRSKFCQNSGIFVRIHQKFKKLRNLCKNSSEI